MTEYRWTANADDRGHSLVTFISERLKNPASNKQIKRMIEKNCCRVNGKVERFASYKIFTGDEIWFDDTCTSSSGKKDSEIKDDRILYDDDDLLIYDKPPGITANQNEGLHRLLLKRFPTLSLVHRLDKDTSGVILLAKTELARFRMEQMFRERHVIKEYIAIVDGVPIQKSGCVENYLGRVYKKGNFVVWGQLSKKEGGLKAVTRWKLERKGRNASVLSCYPETGRTHQLRVHLDGLSHPILGDSRYGQNKKKECTYQAPRCFLHANKLKFNHPCNDTQVNVTAEIPEDMKQAIEVLMS